MASVQKSFKVVFDNATITYNKNWATVEIDLQTLNDDSVIDLHINVHKPITAAWVCVRTRAISINFPKTKTNLNNF